MKDVGLWVGKCFVVCVVLIMCSKAKGGRWGQADQARYYYLYTLYTRQHSHRQRLEQTRSPKHSAGAGAGSGSVSGEGPGAPDERCSAPISPINVDCDTARMTVLVRVADNVEIRSLALRACDSKSGRSRGHGSPTSRETPADQRTREPGEPTPYTAHILAQLLMYKYHSTFTMRPLLLAYLLRKYLQ